VPSSTGERPLKVTVGATLLTVTLLVAAAPVSPSLSVALTLTVDSVPLLAPSAKRQVTLVAV
jgi:hypothetical protein